MPLQLNEKMVGFLEGKNDLDIEELNALSTNNGGNRFDAVKALLTVQLIKEIRGLRKDLLRVKPGRN
jgi:hypothetical protein